MTIKLCAHSALYLKTSRGSTAIHHVRISAKRTFWRWRRGTSPMPTGFACESAPITVTSQGSISCATASFRTTRTCVAMGSVIAALLTTKRSNTFGAWRKLASSPSRILSCRTATLLRHMVSLFKSFWRSIMASLRLSAGTASMGALLASVRLVPTTLVQVRGPFFHCLYPLTPSL